MELSCNGSFRGSIEDHHPEARRKPQQTSPFVLLQGRPVSLRESKMPTGAFHEIFVSLTFIPRSDLNNAEASICFGFIPCIVSSAYTDWSDYGRRSQANGGSRN